MTPRTPSTSARSGARLLLVVVAAVGALVAGLVPGAAAATGARTTATEPGATATAPLDPEADAAVIDARSALTAAQQTLATAQDALDAAAEAFEEARAQHERLATEFAAADDSADAATTAAADARADAADRSAGEAASQTYRRPVDVLLVAESVLRAEDAPTALHRAALLERLAVDAHAEAAAARAEGRVTRERAAERRVIVAGVAGAAADREAEARAVEVAVEKARGRVDAATAALADARTEAAARAEATRAAEAARATEIARAGTQGGEPTDSTRRTPAPGTAAGAAGAGADAGSTWSEPIVAGRTCPVAQPNGFIDSWGFPRSGGRRHQGVDMFAAMGTPLHAVADGTIRRVSTSTLGGLSLHLVDTTGDRFYYAHLSSVAVATGDSVRVGQVIGAVGDSGNAKGTPPHLHWQVHPGDGPAVNPYPLARSLCRGSGKGV